MNTWIAAGVTVTYLATVALQRVDAGEESQPSQGINLKTRLQGLGGESAVRLRGFSAANMVLLSLNSTWKTSVEIWDPL